MVTPSVHVIWVGKEGTGGGLLDWEDQKNLKEALTESVKRLVAGSLADAEGEVGYSLPSYRCGGDLGKLPCLSPHSSGCLSPWLSFTSEGVRKDAGIASAEHIQPLEGLRKAKDYGRVNFSCFWNALGFFHNYPRSQDAVKALCHFGAGFNTQEIADTQQPTGSSSTTTCNVCT